MRAAAHTAVAVLRPVHLVKEDASVGDVEQFEQIVTANRIGSFDLASHAAVPVARNDEAAGEPEAVILTASGAAFEGKNGDRRFGSQPFQHVTGQQIPNSYSWIQEKARFSGTVQPCGAREPVEARRCLGA